MTKGLFALRALSWSSSSPLRWEAKAPSALAAHGNRCARAHPGTDYPSRRCRISTRCHGQFRVCDKGPEDGHPLGPQLETVGPFLVQPSILATQVWSDLRPRETGIAAQ